MKLGYIPDPVKHTDYDFTTGLKPFLTSASDGDVDLSPYATDTQQWELSACAGNATADSVEIINAIAEEEKAKQEGRGALPVPQLSRLFVYSMARSLMDDNGDGKGDINKDEGTYIRLCFEILSRFGICEESVWPYDTKKVFVAPSIKAIRQATGHRIHSYYRIKQSGEDRLTEVIAALRAKHPVVFGTLIDPSFQDKRGPEVVTRPAGKTIGGHAMILVGYANGLFKVKNSWGAGWRKDGYCFFTPEYLSWERTWDLWVPTSGTVFTK